MMARKNYWDDLFESINCMSDETFLHLLKTSGLDDCPYEDIMKMKINNEEPLKNIKLPNRTSFNIPVLPEDLLDDKDDTKYYDIVKSVNKLVKQHQEELSMKSLNKKEYKNIKGYLLSLEEIHKLNIDPCDILAMHPYPINSFIPTELDDGLC